MSATLVYHQAPVPKPVGFDLWFWLLVGLPIAALGIALTIAAQSPQGSIGYTFEQVTSSGI